MTKKTMTKLSNHVNYEYLLEVSKMARHDTAGEYNVLDYGCGKGLLVEAGRQEQIDFYGTELFGSGSGCGIRNVIKSKGLLDSVIREIKCGSSGFEDTYFDLVVSNQVFEHIPDLAEALREIHRVMKDGGECVSIFPYQGAFREGHCEIPFAHWFPANTRLRRGWLYICRILGMGRGRGSRAPKEWAIFFDKWLDENTSLRTNRELVKLFDSVFSSWEHVESDYMRYRLKQKGMYRLATMMSYWPLRWASGWICRQFGSWVVVLRK